MPTYEALPHPEHLPALPKQADSIPRAIGEQDQTHTSHDRVTAMESSQRKRIAETTTDPQLLRLLSNDNSKAVRRAVAKRGRTELDVLKRLAKDPDTEASNSAITIIAKVSPEEAIAEELLTTEALDAAYKAIERHVAHNSQREYYEDRLNTQERLNFTRAMLVAELTSNPMIQLLAVGDLQAIPPTRSARWNLLSAVAHNRRLDEAACRWILVNLRFGGLGPIERCNSPALLRELLKPGTVPPHYHPTIHNRLSALTAQPITGRARTLN